MATLEIDNINVELGEKKIVFAKAAYSFVDWLQKSITYSERVTIPQSTVLDSIFYRPKKTEISGKKFDIFHTFKYKDNGKIVFSGTCKLLQANNKNQYELQLLDSSFQLFENMKNLLSSIDLESSDFIFNSSAYATLKVLNTSVWLWAASSMHEKKVIGNNILSGNLAFSRPSFSVKRVLEASLNANGWQYNLSTNASDFDNLIISANSAFLFTSYEKTFDSTLAAGLLDFSSYTFLNTDIVSTTTLKLTYDSAIRLRGYIDAENDFITQINANSSGATDSETQTFIVNKGRFFYDLTSNVFSTTDATYNIQIQLIGTGNITFEDFLIYTIIDENAFGNISTAGFIDFKVKTYDNLPELEQKELLKHALVSVGGFFSTDNYRKEININSLNELSKINAKDWTTKFIEDSDNVYPLSSYAKINYFEYDNTISNPGNLGRGTFNIDNETFPDTKTKYNSIFAASQEVVITDAMIDNSVYDDTERVNEINTLLGYYEEVGAYTVARFEALNGNTILINYYTNFIAAIQKGIVIEANFNLNKSDFFLFDFTQLVYLEQKKSSFYVLRIDEYMEGKETKVLLLKA